MLIFLIVMQSFIEISSMDPLLCPGGISAIILLPIEINLSHIVPQILQVARAKADVVADEKGGGSESRHDFGT